MVEAGQQKRQVSAPLRLAACFISSLLAAPAIASAQFDALDIKHIMHDTVSGLYPVGRTCLWKFSEKFNIRALSCSNSGILENAYSCGWKVLLHLYLWGCLRWKLQFRDRACLSNICISHISMESAVNPWLEHVVCSTFWLGPNHDHAWLCCTMTWSPVSGRR